MKTYHITIHMEKGLSPYEWYKTFLRECARAMRKIQKAKGDI